MADYAKSVEHHTSLILSYTQMDIRDRGRNVKKEEFNVLNLFLCTRCLVENALVFFSYISAVIYQTTFIVTLPTLVKLQVISSPATTEIRAVADPGMTNSPTFSFSPRFLKC